MALWSLFSSPASRTPLPARPSSLLFFLLAGSFLLTLVPHVEQLPVWVTISVLAAIVIRSILEVRHLPLPSTAFTFVIALCYLAAILLQFHLVWGRDSGMAFTVGVLAVKFFELRGPRDAAAITFSCFFVVMSALLYSQAIELFIYCLIMFWVLTALLMRMQMGDQSDDQLLQLLRRAGVIFLQALPLTFFLFFFFPRYSGKLQITLNENPIGITDELMPGSISKLSEDDSEAMYVKFKSGDVPGVDSMYWRALVLSGYKNGKWIQTELDNVQLDPATLPQGRGTPIDQEITVEPHFKKWIFALDSPVTLPSQPSDASYDFVMFHGSVLRLSGRNLDHKARYLVTSYAELAPQAKDLSRRERGIETRLPDGELDPGVLDLVRQFQGNNPADERSYISNIFRYFWDQKFTYSVDPGQEPVGHEKDWLADFLLKRKTGFCEHYASAFAVLMREAGFPARVVIGYQGGEYNPYANSYKIVQSDAHAWDEVWLKDEKGEWRWVRYDPTAIVAAGPTPQPGQAGNNSASRNMAIANAHHGFFSVENLPIWMLESYRDLQLRRDEIESNWDDLVLSYDPEAQTRLTRAMGFGLSNPVTLVLACLVAMGICGLIFRRLILRKKDVSPVEDLYAQFCRGMAQRGVLRADWEGPLAYTSRVADAFPDKSAAIQDLGWIVARCRYGRAPVDPASPRELKSLLLAITASQAASSPSES